MSLPSIIQLPLNMLLCNKDLTMAGPTNFSAVFLENRENLGYSSDFQVSQDIPPTFSSSSSLQPQTFLMLAPSDTIGSPRIALGTKVLEALPDFATCIFLVERYHDRCHDCAYPKSWTVAVTQDMWRTHAQALAEPRETSEIKTLSTLLCKNAERALDNFETYDCFLAASTGSNLRWEAVGNLYAALFTASLSLPDRDPFFATQKGENRNRRNFSVKMKDCVQACITLSNYMELMNVMMVALLVKNLILQTLISGDVSSYPSSIIKIYELLTENIQASLSGAKKEILSVLRRHWDYIASLKLRQSHSHQSSTGESSPWCSTSTKGPRCSRADHPRFQIAMRTGIFLWI